MPYYRLYAVNAAGHFKHADDGMYPDDDAAVQAARDSNSDLGIEIWQEGRRVTFVPPAPSGGKN